MERERLRQERLKQWGPRRQELEVAKLAEERAKFFDEARERFHNTNSNLFASFLAEQEQRFLGARPPAAFRGGDVVPPSAGSQSQLGCRAEERTEAVEDTGARIIPIAISSQPASPVSPPPPPAPAEERKEVERVIPVLLETSSPSSSSSSSTSSTPVRAPALPALMGDLRIGDSLLRWQNCKVLRHSISSFPPPLIALLTFHLCFPDKAGRPSTTRALQTTLASRASLHLENLPPSLPPSQASPALATSPHSLRPVRKASVPGLGRARRCSASPSRAENTERRQSHSGKNDVQGLEIQSSRVCVSASPARGSPEGWASPHLAGELA